MTVDVQTKSTNSKDRINRYYHEHKDRILKNSMKYYIKNREKILKHRELNKERIANYFKTKKIHCDICNIHVLIGSKCNHYKSKKHILNTYIKNDPKLQ
jgi:hypothetical protein